MKPTDELTDAELLQLWARLPRRSRQKLTVWLFAEDRRAQRPTQQRGPRPKAYARDRQLERLWNPAKDALDFDLSLPDGTKSEDFKYGRGGWSGHHTTPLERHPDTRTFEIRIKSPDGLICDGTVSFTLTTQKFAKSSATIGDFIDAEIVKGCPPPVT